MSKAVTLTFAGDSRSLERTFARVSDGAKEMAEDLEESSTRASRMSDAVGGMNDRIGDAEGKFMGAADTLDGLSTLMGFNIGTQIEMARGFADLAGGINATVGPAIQSMIGKIGILQKTTFGQTVAQKGLNAALRANPIGLVITAIAVLTGAFILAYKKSETFRNIVHGALGAVRDAAQWVGDKFKWLSGVVADIARSAASKFGGLAEIITAPYTLAFRGIASLWNNTVGKLSFKVPGWVPGGIGGSGFDVPDIPMLADGGIARGGRAHIVGERGPELFVPGVTGRVVPNHALGGGSTARVVLDVRGGDDDLVKVLRKWIRANGEI